MKTIQKFVLGLCVALAAISGAYAAGGNAIAWDKAPVKTNDLGSLQNGAKLFVNYCLNCHSAAFMRYNRLQDIGLTNQQIKDNLLFATDKVGDTMKSNIDPKQAKDWFGAVPPDLTLVARSRSGHGGTGADYLYTYLRTYYRDEAKPTGWNNLAFPNVGMPNPLWELQGERMPVYEERQEHGHTTACARLAIPKAGWAYPHWGKPNCSSLLAWLHRGSRCAGRCKGSLHLCHHGLNVNAPPK